MDKMHKLSECTKDGQVLESVDENAIQASQHTVRPSASTENLNNSKTTSLKCEGYYYAPIDCNNEGTAFAEIDILGTSIAASSKRAAKEKSTSISREYNKTYASNECTPVDNEQSVIFAPTVALKAVLVFQIMDHIVQTIREVCVRNGICVVQIMTESLIGDVIRLIQDVNIIIIDARNNKMLEPQNIIKTIRNIKEHRYTTIVAVVRNNYYENTDLILGLLKAGVNRLTLMSHIFGEQLHHNKAWQSCREVLKIHKECNSYRQNCMIETSNQALCYKEIKEIVFSIDRLNNFITTQRIYSSLLNRLKEGILVTNSYLNIQYINTAGEQILNMQFHKHLRNKLIEKIFYSDITPIKQFCESKTLEEYESKFIVKRNKLGALHMQIHVTPIVCFGKTPTHYAFKLKTPIDIVLSSAVHEVVTIETKSIADLLENSLDWAFDILEFEKITNKNPLLYLGLHMFRKFNVFSTLKVDERVCRNWLTVIENHYHADNSYHNSTHAADVLQATGVFLSKLDKTIYAFNPVDVACALIAAAAHDVDHPGRTSPFLCNSSHYLAIRYNDMHVLESHHAALTFKLTLADEGANIFKNLNRDVYKYVRTTIVDMILATEMAMHFEHLCNFVKVFGKEDHSYCKDKKKKTPTENIGVLVRRLLIKTADVSNPVRPARFCIEWARRISEEYFAQTEEEISKNLPVTMPMFNRGTCSIPKTQIGFVENIVSDMMRTWNGFIHMPQLVANLEANINLWKSYEKRGINILEEVVKDKNEQGKNITRSK